MEVQFLANFCLKSEFHEKPVIRYGLYLKSYVFYCTKTDLRLGANKFDTVSFFIKFT